MLPADPSAEDVATCHTRRLRKLDITEMDPSMLLGFLINSEDEWREWRQTVTATLPPRERDGETIKQKQIVHIHDHEPGYGPGTTDGAQGERREAVDEVQSCDESDDETIVA